MLGWFSKQFKWASKSGNVTTYHSHTPGSFISKGITILPLCLVNAVAFMGQLAWANQHLPSWHFIGQVVFAMALESVAVFLAYHAYINEKRNDSALRLKLASYLFALLVAGINYSHFVTQWNKPDAVGLVVGMMSAASPWLWSIYSRSVSRGILFGRGLIEEHAVRMGATRWLWHPIRSFKVMYMATWIGENKPGKAIDAWEESQREKAQAKIEEMITLKAAANGSNGSHPIQIEKIDQ